MQRPIQIDIAPNSSGNPSVVEKEPPYTHLILQMAEKRAERKRIRAERRKNKYRK